MDIKAYIETGKLEAYALGLCDEAEATEVEKLCAQYPELQAELDRIRQSVEMYALSHAKVAPPPLKSKVFEAINDLEKSTVVKFTSSEVKKEAPQIITLYSRVRRLSIAAVGLFILSLAFNVILFNRLKRAGEELTALNSEKIRLAEAFKTNQVKLEGMSHDMKVVSDPHVMKVMMKGLEKSPSSLALIYWNKESREVFLDVKSLPPVESGKQYQLWAIVDGKPVDAGMITVTEGDTSLHRMKDFESAQAFAVTLEKSGGSPVPNMTEMYVMGAVSL